MFPVTITITTKRELDAVLAALDFDKPVAEAPKPVKAAKPASADTQPTAAPVVAPAPKAEASEVKPTEAPKTETPTEAQAPAAIDFTAQIQAPIVRMAGPLGMRDQAVKILAHFGAKKASELAPWDYAEAAAMIAAVLPK